LCVLPPMLLARPQSIAIWADANDNANDSCSDVSCSSPWCFSTASSGETTSTVCSEHGDQSVSVLRKKSFRSDARHFSTGSSRDVTSTVFFDQPDQSVNILLKNTFLHFKMHQEVSELPRATFWEAEDQRTLTSEEHLEMTVRHHTFWKCRYQQLDAERRAALDQQTTVTVNRMSAAHNLSHRNFTGVELHTRVLVRLLKDWERGSKKVKCLCLPANRGGACIQLAKQLATHTPDKCSYCHEAICVLYFRSSRTPSTSSKLRHQAQRPGMRRSS